MAIWFEGSCFYIFFWLPVAVFSDGGPCINIAAYLNKNGRVWYNNNNNPQQDNKPIKTFLSPFLKSTVYLRWALQDHRHTRCVPVWHSTLQPASSA